VLVFRNGRGPELDGDSLDGLGVDKSGFIEGALKELGCKNIEKHWLKGMWGG
jgi:hypothetical protein